jgi:hypothetical protein
MNIARIMNACHVELDKSGREKQIGTTKIEYGIFKMWYKNIPVQFNVCVIFDLNHSPL